MKQNSILFVPEISLVRVTHVAFLTLVECSLYRRHEPRWYFSIKNRGPTFTRSTYYPPRTFHRYSLSTVWASWDFNVVISSAVPSSPVCSSTKFMLPALYQTIRSTINARTKIPLVVPDIQKKNGIIKKYWR